MFHVFLLIAVVFALAAVLCAFATFSRSPTVRRTANRAIYGSLAAALISAGRLVLPPSEDHASTDALRHRRQADR
jgi:hypothetical protein